ncbi:MAG: hypothetical protein QOK39_139 [Acidimicrobiaceae bacterium]|jgi:hypothetical protein|nr:hypothetical protein [Acidimicrobiaceae bacterium]
MPPGRPRREARPQSIARARAGEPWDVEVRLPPAWFYLSCDKATDGRQVPVSVDERIAIEPAIEPYRELLVESLLGWSATAARGGSAGAALRFGIEDRGEMVLATLTIERLERDRGEPAAELANLRPLVERQIDSDEYPRGSPSSASRSAEPCACKRSASPLRARARLPNFGWS